ncbi:MAG TPA: cohesin domain-containing protein [Patescibacteria group bacterium]|nr:cohesin domain-containing protein [Patescibacteria group bacterium]
MTISTRIAARLARRIALGAAAIILPHFSPAASAATAPAIVKAVVSSGTVRSGALVNVTVRIAGANNVGSVPFTLHYDTSILELVASSPIEGGFLRADGAATSFMAAAGPASRGGGLVVGLSRLGSARGARGKGTLCRLTFRARQPGVCPLSFSRASVLDPTGQPLASTFRGTSITVRGAP